MALVDVHWARKEQLPMPQISPSQTQENGNIEV
jgi:hypothetical protein